MIKNKFNCKTDRTKVIILLILFYFLFTGLFLVSLNRPVFSQEGIIASCYYEERTTLKKMWKAREEGDNDKLKILSNQLKAFVDEKKVWAQDLLDLTNNTISKIEQERDPDMTEEQRAEIKERIRLLRADIAINEKMYSDCKLLFFQANHIDSLDIDRIKKEISVLKKEVPKKIKSIQTDIKWHEGEIFNLKNACARDIEARKTDIKWHEGELVNLKNACARDIKARKTDIKWHEGEIFNLKNACARDIEARKNDIKWYKDDIKANKKNKSLVSKHQKSIGEKNKEIADFQKALSSGDYLVATYSKTINDHKKFIKQKNKDISELNKALSSGGYPVATYGKTINNNKESIQQKNKEIAELKKALSSGGYPIATYGKTINNHKESIKQKNKEIAELQKALSSGGYPVATYGKTINNHKESIQQKNKEIANLQKALASGDYPIATYGETINSWKKQIEDINNKKQARRDEFTAEKWMNMKEIRKTIQFLELEIMGLEKQIGHRDEKIAKLTEQKKQLEKLLYHEFIVELPKEESGFIKAVKWCTNAITEVNKTVSKYKKVKKVIDILRSNDPVKAADTLLKAATGKGLIETVAQKLLPENVYKNEYVKKFLTGEYKNPKDALKDFADKNIPDDVKETIQTLKSLRENPQEFLKAKAYDKVMNVIDSNPRLKNTLDSFKDAKHFIDNPELIQEKLNENMKAYANNKLNSNETVTKMKEKMANYEARMNSYEAKIEKIKQEKIDRFENYTKNVGEQIVKNLKSTIENRVGLRDIENIDFVEDLVKGYKFVKISQ